MSKLIKETAQGYEMLSSEDVLFTKRKIFITTEITSESSSDTIQNLMALDADNPTEEVTLYINSPGGEVMSGLAIYDYIQSMSAPVTTVCIGTAASMGAILFLAGQKRIMYNHGRIMIHDPSYSSSNIGGKKPHEIQQQVDKLMETREKLATIISEVTGKSLSQIYEITSKDSYYNATEAVDFGLATNIITNNKNNKKENTNESK